MSDYDDDFPRRAEDWRDHPKAVFETLKANAETFAFNGLRTNEPLRRATKDSTRIEIVPAIVRYTAVDPEDPDYAHLNFDDPIIVDGVPEFEDSATHSADVWLVRLHYVEGEPRDVHVGESMWDACRGFFALASRFHYPVSLDAPDFACETEQVWTFPAALRTELTRTVEYRRRHDHPVYALVAMLELAIHEVAIGKLLAF